VKLGKAILIAMLESAGLNGDDLRLGYHGRTVVDGASLRIEAARVTALVGPNGSGKSTLLRALARLHHPDAGRITFPGGADALNLSAKSSPATSRCCPSRGRRQTARASATSSGTGATHIGAAGATTTRTAHERSTTR
jgi:ATPase subunit of ABC transporter with duplicated ATPase domains